MVSGYSAEAEARLGDVELSVKGEEREWKAAGFAASRIVEIATAFDWYILRQLSSRLIKAGPVMPSS